MLATALYAALAAFGLIFLSVRVIRHRRDGRISVGHQGNADLERAMRVHANFTEYTPLALLLLALAELQGLPDAFVHLLGALLLAGRLMHFLGFRSSDAPGRLRVFGMAATFMMLAITASILLIQLVF